MRTVKYDPGAWDDHDAGATVLVDAVAHIRLAEPSALYADFGGGARLVGYGDEFRLTFPDACEVSAGVPFAVHVGTGSDVVQLGVPLTNFDKRPGLSAVERMVRTVLRERELLEASRRRQREEADKETVRKRQELGHQPPVDEPPVDEPPVDEPPVDEPPVDENPAGSGQPGPEATETAPS